MTGDYIPGPDIFHTWQSSLLAYVDEHLAGLGLAPSNPTDVMTALRPWTAAGPAFRAAATAAQAARQAKDDARANLVSAIRVLVRRLQATPQVDDSERAALGITVPDPGGTPVGRPTTRPVVSIECGGRLRHTLSFTDQGTPTRKAKPAGVLGAGAWVLVTASGAPRPGGPAHASCRPGCSRASVNPSRIETRHSSVRFWMLSLHIRLAGCRLRVPTDVRQLGKASYAACVQPGRRGYAP